MQHLFIDLLAQICQYSQNGAVMRATCRAWHNAPAVLEHNLSLLSLCENGNFELLTWLVYDLRDMPASIKCVWPKYALIHGNLPALKFALFRNCVMSPYSLAIAAGANQWHMVIFLREAGHLWRGGEFVEYLRPDISARLPHLDGLIEQYYCTINTFANNLMALVGETASRELFEWIRARTTILPLNITSMCNELDMNGNNVFDSCALLEHVLRTCPLNNAKCIDGNLSALKIAVNNDLSLCVRIAAKNLIDKTTNEPFPRKKFQNKHYEEILMRALRSGAPELIVPVLDVLCVTEGRESKIIDIFSVVSTATRYYDIHIMSLLHDCQPDIYQRYDHEVSRVSGSCIHRAVRENNLVAAEYFRSINCKLQYNDTSYLIKRYHKTTTWASLLYIKNNFPECWNHSMRNIARKVFYVGSEYYLAEQCARWNEIIKSYLPAITDELEIYRTDYFVK